MSDWRDDPCVDAVYRAMRDSLLQGDLHEMARVTIAAVREWDQAQMDQPVATSWDDAEQRIASAYQIIGNCLDALGIFDSEEAESALNYMTRTEATDPLPWSVPSPWHPIETAPRDGTKILWRCLDAVSVIEWPTHKECFDEGFWMPLPEGPGE